MMKMILIGRLSRSLILKESLKVAVGPLYVHFQNGDRGDFSNAKMYIRPHPLSDSADEKEILPAFGALCTYHKGAFANGYESYRRLEDYAAEKGIVLRGDSFERAVVDVWSTRREDEYLLEIILPTTEPEPAADVVPGVF